MIAAFLAMISGSMVVSEPPKMRTSFTCEVWEIAGSPPKKTKASHRLAILLEGEGPFVPHKTLDPDLVLKGSDVREFLVHQNKGNLRLVGLTGSVDQSSTWNLLFYQEKVGKVWDIAVSRKGQIAYSGFCLAFKKSTTARDIELAANKWNSGK